MQFRLSTLLLAFVVVAMSLAVFGAWGILVSFLLLATVAWIRAGESMWLRVWIAGFVWLIGLCVFGIYAVEKANTAAYRNTCANNLKRIGLALHEYAKSNGAFPPVLTTDAGGQPLHSWRTLILPYLDHRALHARIRLSEPWNSPNNLRVNHGIQDFLCPLERDRSSPTPEISYVALTGPGTQWGQPWPATGQNRRLNPVTVIEVVPTGIERMEPRDIPLDEAVEAVARNNDSLPSWHHDGRNVLLADASVRFIPRGALQIS